MKKWQKDRNYRRVYDSNGNVVSNIITVDGQDITVSEEVFLAYSQADRRERYIAEEVEPGRLLSLEKLLEDHVPLERCGVKPLESSEEILLEAERQNNRQKQKQALNAALAYLDKTEQALIRALFYRGRSTRVYARQLGITQRAVIKRRDRVLRKLKKLLENFEE